MSSVAQSSAVNRLVEMIRLGRTFLIPDYPSTYTDVRRYRSFARRGLIDVYGDDSVILKKFEVNFSRAFSPGETLMALSGDGAKSFVALDAAGPDALAACNKAAVEETLDILREAIRHAKRVVSKQSSEEVATDHPAPELPELKLNPPKQTRRKHGPSPNEHSWTIAEIVLKYPDWKKPDNLADICDELDKLNIPISPKWAMWKQKKPNSWVRAAEYGHGKVVKVIEQRLKMANLHPVPPFPKPSDSRNPR
jgi:hypothetical protein